MGPGEPVAVDVLGPMQVRVGDRPVELPPGRLRVLLAILALSAGRAVSMDRLVDRLWEPDNLPANARRTVQTYITRLRQALGADAIINESAGYVLQTTPDCVDTLRFKRLVARAADEPDVERPLLIEALGLWRGTAFEGLEAPRLRANEGQQLAELRLTATERRIDLDLTDGRATSIVAELRELAGLYPLREPLWARLLKVLDAAGRQAEALEQYEVVRRRIADELGVDPGPELQRIHASLLAGDSLATMPTEGPATKQPTVPRQLPAAITDLVGRSDPLAALDRALDEAVGIVAVHGTGGVGKTTLAVHWAHKVVDRFPDGQLYLNLRGYGPGNPMPPAAAMDALLRGLGVSSDQIPPETDARESLLRSTLAGRRILVLLDNVHNAEQVRPLLPGSADAMAMVTSRSQLRGLVAREGARRVGLDHLTTEESTALLRIALDKAGVRHDPAHLTELARHCGNLPLALAIAAEQATRNSDPGLDELIEELRAERRRLDALQAADETTDLRAVFAWSYRSLGRETAHLFRLLGLYPGPDFGIPAIAALAGTTTAQTRRLLDRLADASLVQRRRGGRFELHDLIREYAAELAEHGLARDVALHRLFEWFIHSSAAGRRFLTVQPPLLDIGEPAFGVVPAQLDDRDQAMTWFDAENRSLSAAVRLAADLEALEASVRLVASGWWWYLLRRRLFDEMRPAVRLAETSARQGGDALAQAQIANLLGVMHGELLDSHQAAADFRRAIALFEQAGHDRGQERALENLGTVLLDIDQAEEAALQLERAIEIGQRLGDARIAVNQLHKLATTYVGLERYAEAADLCVRAIEICRRHDYIGIDRAMSVMTLGEVRAGQGRTDEAIELFRSSIETFRSEDDRWYVGANLINLGRALREAARIEEARDAWREALDLFDELGAPDGRYLSRKDLVGLLASIEPSDNR